MRRNGGLYRIHYYDKQEKKKENKGFSLNFFFSIKCYDLNRLLLESDQEHKWYKKRDKDMKAGHDVVKQNTQ